MENNNLRVRIYLLPAHAGVILGGKISLAGLITSPRTRGGDPTPRPQRKQQPAFSPHTRG